MQTTSKIFASVAVVALAAFGGLTVTPASAQLANASASTLGKGGNATATARGMEALSVNPAGLGMPGSGFTLSLLPVQVRPGLNPVNLEDLEDVEGMLIPSATKEDWLARVAAEGGQTGTVGIDVTELALTLGNIGFQVSTIAGVQMNLSPDLVEAWLYGNAGRAGSPADLSFSGSTAQGYIISTASVSLGLPISSRDADVALGATLKYSVGHFVGYARDQGSNFNSDPVSGTLNFPIVHTDDLRLNPDSAEFDLNNGTGVGLDLGFQMKKDRFSLGAAVLNVTNSFAWDSTTLVYRPALGEVTADTLWNEFEAVAYAGAPDDMKTAVADLVFQPTIAVGAALDLNDDFTVSADIRNRLGDTGIATGPKFHAGVGAEYRGLKILHLRGGWAAITDGTQVGGGASLVLGPISLSAAAAYRSGDLGEAILGQFTLSFGGR
jgi:hypothetical protein